MDYRDVSKPHGIPAIVIALSTNELGQEIQEVTGWSWHYMFWKREKREDILIPSREMHTLSFQMRQSFHHIWMKRDKPPYLMELCSLVKIIEKWVCSKLMLCVILKIASQNKGVGVWKNAQMLVNALRKSMVAVCLANVLRNVWINSINNYKSLWGTNTFSWDFLSY